ncbi:MAG: NAD(P)-binding domain-containing protein [Anaerolineae bacterium]|nr:NAD(P)-binding domain-containing protein [Anaerolineae bacterium]NUQ02461.1 NAD(P)-binding domain-containing protein [Anaerolineae bacterium]
MQLAMIGLGKMGANMNLRLLRGGHQTVVFNRSPEPIRVAAEAGSIPSESVPDLIGKLTTPRAVWMMLPAGAPTEAMLDLLLTLLSPDDIIIDGGNSNYKDTMRRAEKCRGHSIH